MLADITMCVVFQIFSLVVLYFTNLNHPYNAERKPLHLYYTSHLTLASTFCFLSFHCLLMFFLFHIFYYVYIYFYFMYLYSCNTFYDLQYFYINCLFGIICEIWLYFMIKHHAKYMHPPC